MKLILDILPLFQIPHFIHLLIVMQVFDYFFKVIFLGDATSGKSSIVNRIIDKKFNNDYNRLIEFANYNCQIDKFRIRLQLWDTAGEERFGIIPPRYFRTVAAIVLVFDISNRKTFQSIDKWITKAKHQCPDHLSMILVGNKIDLKSRREVSEKEARKFADERSLAYYETSAKDGINIENVFLLLAQELKKAKDSLKISSIMFGSPPIQPTNYKSTCW